MWKMCGKKKLTTVSVFSFYPSRNLEDSSAESKLAYGSQTQKVSEGTVLATRTEISVTIFLQRMSLLFDCPKSRSEAK